MNRFFVGFEMTQCCGLIFTTITRISDTVMNGFFVPFETTQLCSLIVATITRISDTIMNRFFVLFKITQFWCLILTNFTIVSGLIYWWKESIDTSFLAFTYEIKSISYHLSISKESNPNPTWPLASCKCCGLGAAPLRNHFLKESQIFANFWKKGLYSITKFFIQLICLEKFRIWDVSLTSTHSTPPPPPPFLTSQDVKICFDI